MTETERATTDEAGWSSDTSTVVDVRDLHRMECSRPDLEDDRDLATDARRLHTDSSVLLVINLALLCHVLERVWSARGVVSRLDLAVGSFSFIACAFYASAAYLTSRILKPGHARSYLTAEARAIVRSLIVAEWVITIGAAVFAIRELSPVHIQSCLRLSYTWCALGFVGALAVAAVLQDYHRERCSSTTRHKLHYQQVVAQESRAKSPEVEGE